MKKCVSSLLLISVFLAGCLQGPGAESPFEITEFVATIMTEDGMKIDLRLGPSETIHGRDGKGVDAYRYEVMSNTTHAVYHLDRELRVVRVHHPCTGHVDGECRYSIVSWRSEGAPAPFGVSFNPGLGARTDWAVDGRPVPITVDDAASGTVVGSGTWEGETFAAGSYTFDDDSMLPLSFTGRGDEPGWALKRYHEKESLPPVGTATRGPLALEPDPWQGRMFPGEQADDYGRDYAYVDGLDALLEESREARQMLDDGGCVLTFIHSIAGQADLATPLSPVGQAAGLNRTSFRIALQDHQGFVKGWEVVRVEQLLEPRWEFYEWEGADASGAPSCSGLRASPWPSHSSSDLFALASGLELSVERAPTFAVGVRDLSGTASGPEFGYRTFGLSFRPAFVPDQTGTYSYVTYVVMYNPHRGELDLLQTHPGDIERLDEEAKP